MNASRRRGEFTRKDKKQTREFPKSAILPPGLQTKADKELNPETKKRIQDILRLVFKHDHFQPSQLQTIEATLQGKDSLSIFPTGHGKSLCYQLPAFILRPKLTVVISPLIALMNDQVQKLRAVGLNASCFHSEIPKEHKRKTLADIENGLTTLLYISPEQLGSTAFFESIRTRDVGQLVIDEAHCVSTWGHDFRPSYLNIPNARERMGNPVMALFTATAPPHTRNDVTVTLGMSNYFENILPSRRENIEFHTERYTNEYEKSRRVFDILSDSNEPTIVYCATRIQVEELSLYLKERIITCCFSQPHRWAGKRVHKIDVPEGHGPHNRVHQCIWNGN
jgi:ATP-dependent DNA helicase RecQ